MKWWIGRIPLYVLYQIIFVFLDALHKISLKCINFNYCIIYQWILIRQKDSLILYEQYNRIAYYLHINILYIYIILKTPRYWISTSKNFRLPLIIIFLTVLLNWLVCTWKRKQWRPNHLRDFFLYHIFMIFSSLTTWFSISDGLISVLFRPSKVHLHDSNRYIT